MVSSYLGSVKWSSLEWSQKCFGELTWLVETQDQYFCSTMFKSTQTVRKESEKIGHLGVQQLATKAHRSQLVASAHFQDGLKLFLNKT